ncbi:MAG: hypothetical protein V1870_04160 [Candidatus Aenigmatarchaeota archaeon]
MNWKKIAALTIGVVAAVYVNHAKISDNEKDPTILPERAYHLSVDQTSKLATYAAKFARHLREKNFRQAAIDCKLYPSHEFYYDAKKHNTLEGFLKDYVGLAGTGIIENMKTYPNISYTLPDTYKETKLIFREPFSLNDPSSLLPITREAGALISLCYYLNLKSQYKEKSYEINVGTDGDFERFATKTNR